MKKTQVARLLAYVTEMVNQQLLLQNEYLLAANRILRAHLPSRLLLTDPERISAIMSPIKPWVTAYAALVLLLLPSVASR